MPKTGRTPNQIGDDLENKVREELGGKRVPQSGGGKFFKSDVTDGGRFIWSCKATDKSFIRITTDMLREAVQAARGMRGTGDRYTPGVVAEVEGQAYVILALDDFVDLVTQEPGEDPKQHIPASKAATRLARTRRSL